MTQDTRLLIAEGLRRLVKQEEMVQKEEALEETVVEKVGESAPASDRKNSTVLTSSDVNGSGYPESPQNRPQPSMIKGSKALEEKEFDDEKTLVSDSIQDETIGEFGLDLPQDHEKSVEMEKPQDSNGSSEANDEKTFLRTLVARGVLKKKEN